MLYIVILYAIVLALFIVERRMIKSKKKKASSYTKSLFLLHKISGFALLAVAYIHGLQRIGWARGISKATGIGMLALITLMAVIGVSLGRRTKYRSYLVKVHQYLPPVILLIFIVHFYVNAM